MATRPWQDVAKEAQAHRDASIAKVNPPIPEVPAELPLDVTSLPRKLLTEREVDITESPTESILASLSTGKLTSVEVTNAFLRRAGLAQKLVNCITELLPTQALERAKYLDDYYAQYGKPIGPLHGLPVSVKEHVTMKGLRVNFAYVSNWDVIGQEDAFLLKSLWNAGCVFHARTTEPQALMHLETSSNLYGVTVNPFNTKLTCGGSSGGEGALLGLRGSCLGIGTDIGGSIRSPAANNGVYGLRPTTFRMSLVGLSASRGFEHIVPVIGPLSTSLEGVKILMKSVIDTKPWLKDPMLLPFPWRDDVQHLGNGANKRLKVAVLWDDGVVKPHPPVIRAMKEIAGKLKNVPGVEVVDWKPYKHDLAWDIISRLYFPEGGDADAKFIEASGEPWLPLTTFIIKDNPKVRRMTAEEIWQWAEQREKYKAAYASVWNGTATRMSPNGDLEGMVDVILCPVGPGAAPPHGQGKYWGYTAQWNLLDYPAAIFPVTRVDPSIDVAETDYQPLNSQDEFNHKLYDPNVYRGAPVSLQLVGRRYEDEKLLEALEFIKEKTGLPYVESK
ncbi:hypothetical protein FQN54_001841 [Arachnomyces sp. PD_36]|nr:hypothetical protein FQN54_001841 [Arachnomyces sp. PD_36]